MSNTTHDPLSWIDDAFRDLEGAGLRRRLAVRASAQTSRVNLDHRELINFGSNDYLGLAADERLAAAARAASEKEGWGSGASPLVSGRSTTHAELERRLAEFEGADAALLFPSGFAANAGIIPALVDEPDAIFGDAKNHASLIDGCRLAKATRFIYPHSDCDALEGLLKDAGHFRRRLIVSDTIFSMDGDLAPLARLAELAQEFHCMLMVDEAHATGIFGPHGRGVVEHIFSSRTPAAPGSAGGFDKPTQSLPSSPTALGSAGGSQPSSLATQFITPCKAGGYLSPKYCDSDAAAANIQHPASSVRPPHIRVGTLSKALGTAGGFVCGSQSLIDWLANRARTYVFSTAQPAATSAAGIAALDIVALEPHRRTELLKNAATLRARLRDAGWNVGSSESQIIPLVIGDLERTMRLAQQLRDSGFFVPGIRPPSVPEGESLLRLSLCYHHTPEMIDRLLDCLARAGQ
jgi:7-keto-8-aminopelargonate synthetase-like enzyme